MRCLRQGAPDWFPLTDRQVSGQGKPWNKKKVDKFTEYSNGAFHTLVLYERGKIRYTLGDVTSTHGSAWISKRNLGTVYDFPINVPLARQEFCCTPGEHMPPFYCYYNRDVFVEPEEQAADVLLSVIALNGLQVCGGDRMNRRLALGVIVCSVVVVSAVGTVLLLRVIQPHSSPPRPADSRAASVAVPPNGNTQQDIPPLAQAQAPKPATPSAPAEAGKPDTQAPPSVPEGTDTKTAPPAAEKPRDPEAEKLFASLANASDTEQERMLGRLLDLRFLKRLSGEDALFAIAQLQEREKRKNTYSFIYMNMMEREYRYGHQRDKSISVLQEGIDAIQSGKYQLDTYKSVRLTTDALKLAAIADIQKRISEYQDDIAGRRRKRPTYTGPPGAAGIRPREYDSPEKAAAQKNAMSLWYDSRHLEAEAAFAALGDRENAASSLLADALAVGIADEKRHAVADEVIRKYPETLQAAHAMKEKAHLYAEAHDETNERAMLDALVARYPDTEPAFEARFTLGGEYYERKEYDKAIVYLDGLHRTCVDKKKTVYPRILFSLEQVYEKKGDVAAEKKLLEEVITCLENPAFTVNEEPDPDSSFGRVVLTESLRDRLKELQP